jgi:signal transduction histidine kinase
VAEDLRPDAVRRGIVVTFESAPPELALPVYGDRDLLKQAVLNIAVNALEAMTPGGALRLHAEMTESMASLSISDTGPGIPDSQLAEIFKLYFTTKENGSGIGLAVSYRTLQLHGGELSVESRVGKGSTFRLTVPMVVREEAIEESSAHSLTSGAVTGL